MKHLVFSFLVVLAFSISGVAQAKPEWITNVENTIKTKEKRWKLSNILGSGTPDQYSESFRLTARGVTGSVSIQAYTILRNPIETFEGFVIVTDNTLGRRSRKVSLPNFGDEAFIWEPGGGASHTIVQFRKGKTFVNVYMPGKETALRIARHVLEHVP